MTATYGGNYAGPGPSYFRVFHEFMTVGQGENGAHVYCREWIHVESGSNFWGSLVGTNFHYTQEVNLYDEGDYCDSSWWDKGYYSYGSAASNNATAGYQGGSGYHESSVTSYYYPDVPEWVPNAPTIGSITKNSDSSVTVGFSCNPTTARPYRKIQILRKTDSGEYVQIAEFGYSSGISSYVDNTTSANHSYSYKVRAKNNAGVSSKSGATSTIYTSPAAPTDIAAVYNIGSTSVAVSWENNAPHVASYQVQAANNSSFTGATTYSANSETYIDTNPPLGSAWYRVRAIDVTGAASAWSSAVNVVTLCAPSAPTMLTPSEGAVFAMPSRVSIKWKHNSNDGTAQSNAVVAVSTNGGSTWSEYTVTGSSNTYSLNVSSMAINTEVQVKVKTKGTYASYGPYCNAISFSLRAAPSVVITSPASDYTEIATYPLSTSWSTSCSSGSIVETVWELDGITHSLGTDTGYVLNADEKLLDNGSEFVLRVTVKSSYGITASTERIFVTDYVEPAPPVVGVTYNTDNFNSAVTINDNQCSIYKCDGNEVEGDLYSLTYNGMVRYFEMPDVGVGDVLWWSNHDQALFLTQAGKQLYDTSLEITTSLEIAEEESATALTFETMPTPSEYLLYRVSSIGEELIASGLNNGVTIIDRIPPLNTEYLYKVCAMANSGASSAIQVSALIQCDPWFVWNYGSSWDSISQLLFEPSYNHKLVNNSESVLFEGDALPTCYGGNANTNDLSISGEVYGVNDMESFVYGLGGWCGVRSIFRDPFGGVYPVRVSSVSSQSLSTPYLYSINVAQEQVL